MADASQQPQPNDARDALAQKYLAQRRMRGVSNWMFGLPDLTNQAVNAGIRDVGYFTGLYDPNKAYQFSTPSQDAANLATQLTGANIVPESAVSPQVAQQGANQEYLIGANPIGPGELATGLKLGMAGLGGVRAELAKQLIDPVTGQPMFGAFAQRPGFNTISAVKLRRPLDELQAMVDQRPSQTQNLLPNPIVRPEDFQLGSKIVGTPSDRSAAGLSLVGLGGKPFQTATELVGGGGYMRGAAQQQSGSVWANEPTAMLRLSRDQIGDAASQPTFLAPVLMGAEGVDFSHMMQDTVRQQLAQAKLTADQKNALDLLLRQEAAGDWPGVRQFVKSGWDTSGTTWSRVAKELDKSRAAELGAPDIGLARLGVTAPELFNAPNLASGYAIGRVDPDAATRVFTPDPAHPSYSAGLKGTNFGQFAAPIPFDVMYSDYVANRAAQGGSMAVPHLLRAAMTSTETPVTQTVTPQWQDRASNWLEQWKKLWG